MEKKYINGVIHMKRWSKKWDLFLLGCMLVFSVLLWMCLNLLFNANHISSDAVTAYSGAIEMVKQKSLFLNHYSYGSSLLLDSPAPLVALIFCALGKNNIQLAQGMANIIFLVLILILLFSIVKKMGKSIRMYLIIGNLLVIPYASGMLYYSELFFLSYAQYSVRLLFSLLIINAYIDCIIEKKPFWKQGSTWLAFFTFFIGSLSSGVFYCLTFIAPFVIKEIFSYTFKKDYSFQKQKQYFIKICLFISAGLAGILFQKVLIVKGIVSGNYLSQGSFLIRGVSEIWDGIKKSFEYLLYSFGGMGQENMPLISKSTISLFLAISFLVLVTICLVLTKRKEIKVQLSYVERECIDYIWSIFFFQVFMMVFMHDCAPRYWYIPIQLLFIVVGISLAHLYEGDRTAMYRNFILTFGIITSIFWIENFNKFAEKSPESTICNQIIKIAEKHDIQVIIDREYEYSASFCPGRMCYVFSDGKITGLTYRKDNSEAIYVGTPTYDLNTMKDQVMILVSSDSMESNDHCKFVTKVERYYIYEMKIEDYMKYAVAGGK